MLKKSSLEYFRAFQNKDIKRVRSLLSPNISFRDWEFEAIGLENVILAYKNIFKTAITIQVEIINLNIQGLIVMAELKITINQLLILKVVDVLEYSSDAKIQSIRAYKG